VVERDDDKIQSDAFATIEKKVYQFNLVGVTALSGDQSTNAIGSTGKTVDQLTVAELVANGIRPVEKQLFVDLNVAGYNQTEKVEGLAVIDPYTIAVVNDNDFGVAQITVNPDGTFTRNYIPEPIQLGIIDVRHNALDASDRDGKINIRPWPIKGLYMPDTIASYKVGPKTFLVTANEGDAREYITEVENPETGETEEVGSVHRSCPAGQQQRGAGHQQIPERRRAQEQREPRPAQHHQRQRAQPGHRRLRGNRGVRGAVVFHLGRSGPAGV
jgi:hypothetical protein